MVFQLKFLDRLAIVKTERNVGKGARAARINRNKMVFKSVHNFFMFSLSTEGYFYIQIHSLVILQIREQKKAAVLKEKRELSGSKCPPRVIVSKSLPFFFN